jgi:hypothetical protein
MAEFVHDAHQDFWQSPVLRKPSPEAETATGAQSMAEVCAGCRTEYLIGARFCHSCGQPRPAISELRNQARGFGEVWTRTQARLRPWLDMASSVRKVPVPSWLQYLHFHEIKRWVGLPTASLIAFLIGLGCVAGALCVSFFYRASNLAEFQAIQMWRLEWLLAATASFVAGILLKIPAGRPRDDE